MYNDYADIVCGEISKNEDCGILIGNSIVCDGYNKNRTVAVFSHFHSDHIEKFPRSFASCDVVLVSIPTLEALKAIFGNAISYRQNVHAIPFGVPYITNTGEKITLYPANHIPGSSQIFVETSDGKKIMYSGDFNFPDIEVPQCDYLILDATHGTKQYDYVTDRGSVLRRTFERIFQEIASKKPVHIRSHKGVMQIIMAELEKEIDNKRIPKQVKFFANKKDKKITENLNQFFNNSIREIHEKNPHELNELYKNEIPYILFGSHTPEPQDDRALIVHIDATSEFKQNQPIIEYGEKMIKVNYSAHASFSNILEYVKNVNPELVITDNSRSKSSAIILANEISQKFDKIKAFALPTK